MRGVFRCRKSYKRYWKIKHRRSDSFYDIALKTYIYMMINIFVMGVIRILISFWLVKRLTYIICGFICSIVNSVIVICVVKKPKTKIELYTDGRTKQLLLFMLNLIFSIGFWVTPFKKIDYYGEPLIDVRKLSLRRN